MPIRQNTKGQNSKKDLTSYKMCKKRLLYNKLYVDVYVQKNSDMRDLFWVETYIPLNPSTINLKHPDLSNGY